MATRRSEWLASIKPILDKDAAKKDAAALAQELGDILEVKVDASPENLDELAKEFNAQLKTMGKQPIVFSEKTLKGIVSQFSVAITAGIKDGIDKSKLLLKDLTSLQEAYNRNKNASGAKTGKRVRSGFVNSAKGAFEYEPSDTAIKIGNNLRAITNEFNKAVNWEDQYAALLKYIKAYEKLESVTSDPKSLEKWATIGDYAIQDLKDARPGIEHSLQNIFKVAYGKVATGLTDTGDIDVDVKLTPIKMIDAYDITGGKGHIEVEVKPVVKKAKKNETPNAFRGVHRPSGGEGRSISRSFLGGDFWTDNDGKGLFLSSYGEESGEADAKNLTAVFKPLNKLVVDAEEGGRGDAKAFNEIDQLKFLQHLLPGIESFVNTADTDSRDYVQKFYNEMARQAGFDLFEVTNVNEGADELATTLVPLQDRIIEWASKIPEYYDVEKFTPEMERDIISRQKGSSEKWYTQTIERLEAQMAQAVTTEDVTETKYLQGLIPRVKEMYSSAMANFDEAIAQYGGYIEESVIQGLPEVISANADGKLIPKFSADDLKNKIQEFVRLSKELDQIRDSEPNKKDYDNVEEYKEAKDLYDNLEDTYQQKIDLLYNQLINGLPNNFQNEIDNLLIDAVDGAVKFEDVFDKLQPHLTYNESAVNGVDLATSKTKNQTKNDKQDVATKETEAKLARTKELVAQMEALNDSEDESVDSVKRKLEQLESIFNLLKDESLMTDEILHKYGLIEQSLDGRYQQMQSAEIEADARRNGLVDQLDELGADSDDEDVLQNTLDERKNIFELLQKENLLTDEIKSNYDAVNKEIEERIALQMAARKAEQAAEKSFDNLDSLYDKINETDDPDAANALLEERKRILSEISPLVRDDYEESIEAETEINSLIEKRIALLRDASAGKIDFDDIDDVLKENGDLESKLERLQDVSGDWGSKVKDSEVDDDDDAIESLQQFEETYDRIVLKLANGRNIEILPNAKGLRALYKYYDGIDSGSYGESEIEDVSFERVKREAVATEQIVDGLNESLEKTQQLTSGDGAGSGTGDASLADLEAERAKSEALQDELDHRIGALQAAHDEKEMLQSDLNIANEQIKIAQDSEMAARARADETDLKLIEKEKHIQALEEQLSQAQISDGDALFAAEQRVKEAEEKAYMYDRAMTSMEEEMAGLRGQLANTKTGGGEGYESVSSEELKTLLNSIVYNVKIAHDDSDKTANKIEINESTLESTLTKVFANILNPQTQQNDSEQEREPWALENTLQTVKDVLDSIDNKIVKVDVSDSSGGDRTNNKNPYLLTDSNGKALTVYRGTRDSFGGLVSNRTGTFGTDNPNIAKGYTHGDGKVFAYNVEMHNPLEIQAKGAQLKEIPNLGNAFEALTDPILKELRSLWSQITTLKEQLKTASGFDREVTIPNKIGALKKRIQEISEDESHVYGVGGTDLFARKAKKNGYDGVIFRDLVDPSSGTPPQERVPSNIIVTFDENQMHLLETLSVVGNEMSKVSAQEGEAGFDEPKVAEIDDAKGTSYALESTLQIVKGILDNIQTNTSKIGTIEAPNVDTIAGTALDSRLTEIKSVLESIDGKIAKGGVIATRGAVKQANAQAVESDAKTQVARSNMMKSLINDYKTLGKLSAKFASDGDLETKARLDNLKEEISRKRKSLKLSMDESASLREKYSMAFDAEKRLLDAEKAQEEINKKKKKNDKEAEAAWKKQVKDAQRATGINAATTAANAGDQTVVRAIGAEGVSKDIENKAKELSDNIKTLRMLRDEIDKKGTQASDGDRDNLSKQIAKVKELKTEVDSYLKIHEKYSGEGVTDLGDASNFGAVGTDQYWNNITAAIKNASNGKVVINSLNADTGELTGTTKIAANTFAQWSATVDPLTGRLSMLRTGIKKTETVIEQIKRKTKEIFTYFSGSSIIFKAVNELKKGVQYVRDIDLALTELKKVTDETEETYRKFLDTASKTAAKVGSTIKDVVSSTADWARLGYSMKEAAQFAETTQILMNVSEFTDVSQATDTLISSVQAFGYTAETSMEVVDLLNTIGEIIAYR